MAEAETCPTCRSPLVGWSGYCATCKTYKVPENAGLTVIDGIIAEHVAPNGVLTRVRLSDLKLVSLHLPPSQIQCNPPALFVSWDGIHGEWLRFRTDDDARLAFDRLMPGKGWRMAKKKHKKHVEQRDVELHVQLPFVWSAAVESVRLQWCDYHQDAHAIIAEFNIEDKRVSFALEAEQADVLRMALEVALREAERRRERMPELCAPKLVVGDGVLQYYGYGDYTQFPVKGVSRYGCGTLDTMPNCLLVWLGREVVPKVLRFADDEGLAKAASVLKEAYEAAEKS